MHNLDELKTLIRKFAKDRDWEQFHTPKNLATAVGVEAAELQEIFMWLTPEESLNLPSEARARVEDEVGDILICLVNFAMSLNIDPMAAASQKLQKNELKYPVNKSKGVAKKYTEL